MTRRPHAPFPQLPPLLVLVALTAPAAEASAQSAKDVAAARQAFKEGEEAENKGDLAGAVARYQQALAIKATPQLHLRIGAVEEKQGRLVDALASYERGLEKAASLPAVAKVAREQIEALRLRIPLVTIVVAKAPADLVVTLDGAPVAAAGLGKEMAIDPGTHKIHAQAPGWQPRDRAFTAEERGRARVELELQPVESALPPPPPPPPPRRVPVIVLTAGGSALLVTGVALLAASYVKDSAIDAQCRGSARTQCPLSQQGHILSEVSAANALRFSGLGTGIVGAAGAAAGIYLLVKKPPPPTGWVRAVPAVGPGGAGAAIVGRF